MPAPFTIVTILDEDGDEFPMRLPGVYRGNRAADGLAAIDLLRRDSEMRPRGELRVGSIEYVGDNEDVA